MLHLADCPAVAGAELAQDYQILSFEIEAELDADFQRILLVVVARPHVARCGGRLGRGRAEGEALLVLPLHRLGGEG
jgi:hypothetical protein